jgi:hypothetical protein
MPDRRLPRANAFAARGVTLKYPERSWSGVSLRDGAVVLAMRTVDVRVNDDGCSCLLWARAMQWVHGPSKDERLEHCQLALLHGAAEGLLDYGESAGVNPAESVSLRVIRICGEYWAKWGSASRPRTAQPGLFAREYMREARLAALAG